MGDVYQDGANVKFILEKGLWKIPKVCDWSEVDKVTMLSPEKCKKLLGYGCDVYQALFDHKGIGSEFCGRDVLKSLNPGIWRSFMCAELESSLSKEEFRQIVVKTPDLIGVLDKKVVKKFMEDQF